MCVSVCGKATPTRPCLNEMTSCHSAVTSAESCSIQAAQQAQAKRCGNGTRIETRRDETTRWKFYTRRNPVLKIWVTTHIQRGQLNQLRVVLVVVHLSKVIEMSKVAFIRFTHTHMHTRIHAHAGVHMQNDKQRATRTRFVALHTSRVTKCLSR